MRGFANPLVCNVVLKHVLGCGRNEELVGGATEQPAFFGNMIYIGDNVDM